MAINFKIKERSAEDIQKEIEELFELCKPYLEEGWGLLYALEQIHGMRPSTSKRWYKDLKKYCWDMGYYTDKTRATPYKLNAKYYYRIRPYNDKFMVKKTINYKELCFGVVNGLAKAKCVVRELNNCNWDKSQFDRIRKKYDC